MSKAAKIQQRNRAQRRNQQRQRPTSPADIVKRRQEARQEAQPDAPIEAERLRLAANGDVAVRNDVAGRIVRARRQDVFDLFQSRGKLGAGAYDAIRKFQDDIAVLHRVVSSGGDLGSRVGGTAKPDGLTDARLAAGARIEAVLDRVGPASARLLVALCEPAVIEGRGVDWREVVVRVTGERLPDAQGAILRVACENLAGAYQRATKRHMATHAMSH
jgi:hypothetical protein